jgi:hypothetical protein
MPAPTLGHLIRELNGFTVDDLWSAFEGRHVEISTGWFTSKADEVLKFGKQHITEKAA